MEITILAEAADLSPGYMIGRHAARLLQWLRTKGTINGNLSTVRGALEKNECL